MTRNSVKQREPSMIDCRIESLITLDEAAKLAPGYRPGKCASTAAVRRWIRSGMRGVRLESTMAGGRRCTSREAVQRFFEALTAAREPERPRKRARRKSTAQLIKQIQKEHGSGFGVDLSRFSQPAGERS